MKNLSKYIVSFLMGVGIGAMIELFFTILFKNYVVGVPEFVELHSPVFVKVVQTIIYGGFGIISTFLGTVYTKKNLSLFAKTTIHLFGILIYFIFAGFTLKWFDNISSAIMSTVSYFIIYMIIWTIIYLISKSEIEKINKKLN